MGLEERWNPLLQTHMDSARARPGKDFFTDSSPALQVCKKYKKAGSAAVPVAALSSNKLQD